MKFNFNNNKVNYNFDSFSDKKIKESTKEAIASLVIRVAYETGFSSMLKSGIRVLKVSNNVYDITFSNYNNYICFRYNLITAKTKLIYWG